MVAVGRRCPGSWVCHQPATEATRNHQPRTHPHFRLAADTRWPGRREHEHHKATGRIQHVEHNQVSCNVGLLIAEDSQLRVYFLGGRSACGLCLQHEWYQCLNLTACPLCLFPILSPVPRELSLRLPLPVSLTQRLFLVGASAPSISPLLLWQWELKEKEIPSVILTQICSPSTPLCSSLHPHLCL